jgi:hypothetical protein
MAESEHTASRVIEPSSQSSSSASYATNTASDYFSLDELYDEASELKTQTYHKEVRIYSYLPCFPFESSFGSLFQTEK